MNIHSLVLISLGIILYGVLVSSLVNVYCVTSGFPIVFFLLHC